jgi:hypothetical protein
MMVMSSREAILMEAQRTRAHAASVLHDLLEAQAACESTLATEKRSDMIKQVTGQSSLEVAIAETRKLIESLDRAIAGAARELDADCGDVAGTDGLEAVVVAGRLAISGRAVARAG